MSLISEFTKGFWKENPTFRLMLGICPTLAISTMAINGIAMGLAVTFVLVFSNLFVSALRKYTPDKVRIAVFVILIAAFVTIVDLVMHAYFFSLHKTLGIFIPLIVVNCIVFARAEAFAAKNPVLASVMDGLGMGIGFTCAVTFVGAIREILGNGTIFGVPLFGKSYLPFLIMVVPPGAFVTLGFILGMMNTLTQKE
ncbi:MAG: electron transport complex subunit E [Candidatus Schekmanbacteria bacterium]|nr:electron transport complex subunit E [Candidatus Schekmanbacteria bacterium]